MMYNMIFQYDKLFYVVDVAYDSEIQYDIQNDVSVWLSFFFVCVVGWSVI